MGGKGATEGQGGVKEGETAEAEVKEVKEVKDREVVKEGMAGEVGSVVSLLRDNSWTFFFARTM